MVVFIVHRVASALMYLGVSGRHFLTCYLLSVVPVLLVSCVHARVQKRLACHVNLDLSGQYTVQLAAFSHPFSRETDSAVVVSGAHINELWALYDNVNSQLPSRSLFSRHRRQLPKGYLRPSCSSDTERWLRAQNDEFGHRTTNAGAVWQDQAQNNETRAPNDGRRPTSHPDHFWAAEPTCQSDHADTNEDVAEQSTDAHHWHCCFAPPLLCFGWHFPFMFLLLLS